MAKDESEEVEVTAVMVQNAGYHGRLLRAGTTVKLPKSVASTFLERGVVRKPGKNGDSESAPAEEESGGSESEE